VANDPKVSPNDTYAFDDDAVDDLDEVSIDELLAAGEHDSDDEISINPDLEDTGTFLPGDVLMSPEEIFSKNELDEDS
jgi:hypothetical protein